MRHALLAALVILSLPAAAQVHKCVDAAGKVSYTEAPCPAAAKQSQQMMGSEATSTYDPYAHERTMRSYQRDSAINRAYAPQLNATGDNGGRIIDNGPNGPGGINRQRDAQSLQRAQQQIEASRRAQQERDARAELARERAAQQARSPAKLSRCDSAFCYDTTGGSYMRNGDGTLIKSGGGVCRPVPGLAGQYNCQ